MRWNLRRESSSIIRVEGMRKHYLRSFSLEIEELTLRAGTIHLLVGPNGAGKTTLLRCIMGLTPIYGIDRPDRRSAGSVTLPESYVMPLDLTLEGISARLRANSENGRRDDGFRGSSRMARTEGPSAINRSDGSPAEPGRRSTLSFRR
ncbi:MAG: ATP-binding cassette domain-containing protein [Bacillus subtilis]|nr:ATP-binding cassette domain-containing protein [Bacillus subtilis]